MNFSYRVSDGISWHHININYAHTYVHRHHFLCTLNSLPAQFPIPIRNQISILIPSFSQDIAYVLFLIYLRDIKNFSFLKVIFTTMYLFGVGGTLAYYTTFGNLFFFLLPCRFCGSNQVVGLATSTLTHWAISLAHCSFLFTAM